MGGETEDERLTMLAICAGYLAGGSGRGGRPGRRARGWLAFVQLTLTLLASTRMEHGGHMGSGHHMPDHHGAIPCKVRPSRSPPRPPPPPRLTLSLFVADGHARQHGPDRHLPRLSLDPDHLLRHPRLLPGSPCALSLSSSPHLDLPLPALHALPLTRPPPSPLAHSHPPLDGDRVPPPLARHL